MLHGVYAVVDGEVVQGVSAQEGMPGCKIACRIGPSPKIQVQDGILDKMQAKRC